MFASLSASTINPEADISNVFGISRIACSSRDPIGSGFTHYTVEATDEKDVARWILEKIFGLGVGAMPVGCGSVRRCQEFTGSAYTDTHPSAGSNAGTNTDSGTHADACTSTGTHAARTRAGTNPDTNPDLHGNL